ncbi:MAG: NAD-dependent epimerase/dehydratase family protein [Anaerolineae bacterium]|nr:NAD-dependent epimerase/dehydratase family protein [Anaerolineae bacterium]
MNTLGGSDVVVTGGAGAIGSRLVKRLLSENVARVLVIDNLSSGYQWLLPDDERVEFFRGDVVDLPQISLVVSRPIVYHLAAFFANQNSVDHPLDDLRTNGEGTLTTLMWAKEHKARRVVYASAGCSIAGHIIDGPIREDMPVSLHMDTPYQITKALGEFYCNYFNPMVSTVRCRFFNSYGPGELPGRYRNVIPNFIWKAMHNLPLIITGTGQESRDFIFVEDLVDGLLRAAVVPEAGGEAFNLGTGIQTRIIDLAKMIIELCHSKSSIEFAPRRSWDNSFHRQASIELAHSVLGFNPQADLREGLAKTVNWFLTNRQEIERALEGSML